METIPSAAASLVILILMAFRSVIGRLVLGEIFGGGYCFCFSCLTFSLSDQFDLPFCSAFLCLQRHHEMPSSEPLRLPCDAGRGSDLVTDRGRPAEMVAQAVTQGRLLCLPPASLSLLLHKEQRRTPCPTLGLPWLSLRHSPHSVPPRPTPAPVTVTPAPPLNFCSVSDRDVGTVFESTIISFSHFVFSCCWYV